MDTFWIVICRKYYGNNAIDIIIKKGVIYIRFSNDLRTRNRKLYLFSLSNRMETPYPTKHFAATYIIPISSSAVNCWNIELDC